MQDSFVIPAEIYREGDLDSSRRVNFRIPGRCADELARDLIVRILSGSGWQLYSWMKPSDADNDEF